MRILIGTDTYRPTVNGAAAFTDRLAHGLVERGHDVQLVCPAPSGPARTREVDGIEITEVGSFEWFMYEGFRVANPIGVHGRMARVLRRLAPDVVHLQTGFVIGRGLSRACARHRVPLVATNHLMPENFFDHFPTFNWLKGPGSRWLWGDVENIYRHAAVVTSPTPRAVELIEANTSLPDVRAVSNGIDERSYQSAVAASPRVESPLRVLFVGRLDQEKRVGDIVTAFSQMTRERDIRLDIVGEGGHKQQWQELTQRLGLADRVTFHGFVDDDALLRHYAAAHVFCMPGVAELQSLVTMEAMASGLPVVAADAMALPHLVHPGENGFLFAPGDAGELARHLTTLLDDPDLRRRMGEKSREIVAGHAMAATLDTFEGIYTEAIERARG